MNKTYLNTHYLSCLVERNSDQGYVVLKFRANTKHFPKLPWKNYCKNPVNNFILSFSKLLIKNMFLLFVKQESLLK